MDKLQKSLFFLTCIQIFGLYCIKISICRNETDGGTIQQAVWRPTGTQLGKKKSGKDANKSKKGGSSPKKKVVPRKIRAKNPHVGDGSSAETLKQPVVQPNFVFPQQNVHQQSSNEIQTPSQPLSSTQVIFASTLDLVQQPQHLYHHPGLNVPKNWPLDLVQSSHHYPQVTTIERRCRKIN